MLLYYIRRQTSFSFNVAAFSEQVNTLLNDSERSLIEIYCDIQQLSEDQHGPDTLVLMEVGSFFEVYGVDNDDMCLGKPKEIAEILNLQLTRKNKRIAENSLKNPLMAGFPTASFDRHMQRLTQLKKYTIVVIRQKGQPPHVTRYCDVVLSPGVNFDYALSADANAIVAMFVDCTKGMYSVGYAAADVTTGKTHVGEFYGTSEDPTLALDDVFHHIHAQRTAEVHLYPIQKDINVDELLRYLEMHTDQKVVIHTERFSIQYQNELCKRVYDIQSQLSPIEYLNLEQHALASEALTALLEVIIDQDAHLLEHVTAPHIIQHDQFLYLGNNPLEQLNIVSRDSGEHTVAAFMDRTSTSMGRRLLHERLTHPITDRKEIEARYDLVDAVAPITQEITQELRSMYDGERLMRRMALARLHPFEMNFVYDSLRAAQSTIELMKEQDTFPMQEFIAEQTGITQCLGYIEQHFDLDATTHSTQQTIRASFFHTGVHPELDILVEKKTHLEEMIESIRQKILNILQEHTGKIEEEYILVKQLEKEGHYIHMTKSRYQLIKEPLQEAFISLDGTVHAFSDFTFKIQKTNVKITSSVIEDISEQIVSLESKIIGLVKELFAAQLGHVYNEYGSVIERTMHCVAQLDVAVSSAKIAREWKHVRPQILDAEKGERALECIQLRHPLVEEREESGIYVPNTIAVGTRELLTDSSSVFAQQSADVSGVLLYGINSSGKSSLMKSIGVAIVLAQAGFFVPAERMRFTVCTELFTRIIARDNFEKGLSSFAVEMMELKNIFARATERSVILGDEVSHGTETTSALAIVAASIQHLSENGALFFFATHLHQLQDMEEVSECANVVSVHLAVHYDAEADCLVFDRTVQSGSGSARYGLEFAQSLHMNQKFLQRASDIRKRLTKEESDITRLARKETSAYHTKLLLSSCAVCGAEVDDTHHIKPQHEADADGMIEHFTKDHQYNLVPLCKSCHKKVHSGKLSIHGFAMTSHGPQLQYEEQ